MKIGLFPPDQPVIESDRRPLLPSSDAETLARGGTAQAKQIPATEPTAGFDTNIKGRSCVGVVEEYGFVREPLGARSGGNVQPDVTGRRLWLAAIELAGAGRGELGMASNAKIQAVFETIPGNQSAGWMQQYQLYDFSDFGV